MDASIDPIDSIGTYCRRIGIPEPEHPNFDIRRFEDNMRSVKPRVSPFKHELFAVALKLEGSGSVRAGLDEYPLGDAQYIFFNSPYQVVGWEIVPDWEGYYVMFTKGFASVHLRIPDMTTEFPFLRLDRALPFRVSPGDARQIHMIFQKVHTEYYGDAEDKFGLIAAYTTLLLRYVQRTFNSAPIDSGQLGPDNQTAEYRLVSRFQVSLEEAFYYDQVERMHPLSVAEMAERLYVHPNYLNSVVKRVTGQTARELVEQQTLAVAKRLLMQPGQSVKEVAAALGFAEPTHFSRFFKRLTQVTPTRWRGKNA